VFTLTLLVLSLLMSLLLLLSQSKWTEALTKWEASLPSDLGTEMWWAGIPARCRTRVWPVLIGNAMKITPEVFNLSLQRSKRLRAFYSSKGSAPEDDTSITSVYGHEQSLTVGFIVGGGRCCVSILM
jgi:hypothetical protein